MNVFQGRPKQEPAGEGRRTAPTEINLKDMGKFIGAAVFLVIAVVVLANSLYIVREDEVAVIREFGDIKRIVIPESSKARALEQVSFDQRFKDVVIDTGKGLKFKVPFITTVEKDNGKLITYVSNTAKINTKDKIKYDIDMYAQWRISHPGMFRSSLSTITHANSKIDEVLYAVVIDRVNRLNSYDFLNNKDRLEDILTEARVDLNRDLATQGIEIVDINIFRTVIPTSNIDSTYKKMIAEREAIAQQIRAEGLELYNNTVADTDRKVSELLAESIETAERIKGEADAEALKIYADSFSKDEEFYVFWRTLKSYENTVDEDTVVFLDKNNKYLKTFSGEDVKINKTKGGKTPTDPAAPTDSTDSTDPAAPTE